jgi:2,3-bisphosphoglycerate-independent phosphoglycerate mutase
MPASAAVKVAAACCRAALPRSRAPGALCSQGENVSKDEYNAVFTADTPCMDTLQAVPGRWRTIKAHGTAVGLPSDDDMGNSEVGHNALGSGQLIDQGASLVDKALASGSLFEGAGFAHIAPAFAAHTLHLIGLLSDGGVHSRTNQLFAIVRGAAERGAKRIRLHVLTDGRDVPDGSSLRFVAELEAVLKEVVQAHGCDAAIASGGGRMCVTMDRYEADWKIVERGWAAHVRGEAAHTFTDALTAVRTLRVGGALLGALFLSRAPHAHAAVAGRLPLDRVQAPSTLALAAGLACRRPLTCGRALPPPPRSPQKEDSDKPVSDQWLDPFVIVDAEGAPVGAIHDGDAVVLFNFRADRVIEISKAFEYEHNFAHFDRVRWPRTLFAGLMQYDGDLKLPAVFLVPPPVIAATSGEFLARNGLKTFVCSETQKFGVSGAAVCVCVCGGGGGGGSGGGGRQWSCCARRRWRSGAAAVELVHWSWAAVTPRWAALPAPPSPPRPWR